MTDTDRLDFLESLLRDEDRDLYGDVFRTLTFAFPTNESDTLREAIDRAMKHGRAA